ncbi:Slp family lipoprotein [Glaciecola petra]|uniref:Slp family lipoprotein n=1 Tax=Glaciecola petra TaxID=3075602 RepID=A0ABU2ZQI2_9ALTE|nr:Slp family lipoprotein [Aestuariibacter sp. P117]MDT0594865.1 Slp family lipoprotein [Aestuariibacter sp. P117]
MEIISKVFKSLLITIAVVLTGCTGAPNAIKVDPFTNLTTFAEATLDKDNETLGTQARWAGKIATVRNNGDISEIEIVLFPSRETGKPQTSDISIGRFKAIVPLYVDPNLYARGRLITVLGEVANPTKGQIGEHEYTYQTLNAKGVYLWKDIKRINTDPLNMMNTGVLNEQNEYSSGPWSSQTVEEGQNSGTAARATITRNNGDSHSIIIPN